LGNDLIEFSARFNGMGRDISIPVGAVSAIYARESGNGLSFEVAAPDTADSKPPTDAEGNDETPPEPPLPSGKPTLRRVK
jgi:stringent starvation protein B